MKQPSKYKLKKFNVIFVPTNCYAPEHWSVKDKLFPFDSKNEYQEDIAIREASLLNAIAEYCVHRGYSVRQLEIMSSAILRMLGSQSEHAKIKP